MSRKRQSRRTVAAAEFKANCLRLLDEVHEGSGPITVTKRGKPFAVLSAAPPERADGLLGRWKDRVVKSDIPVHDDWSDEFSASRA